MTPHSLHTLYCHETGFAITMDYAKAEAWLLWIAYRKPPLKPFTEADLVFLIRHLIRAIKRKERKPYCLRFYTLLAPDTFEVELEQARVMRVQY